MGMRQISILLTVAATIYAQAPPADDAPPPPDREIIKILAQARENALKYSRDLPDFVCNQVTRRNLDQSGTSQRWREIETATDELSYAGHKEEFKTLTVNGKTATHSDHKAGSGTMMSVPFSELPVWIFDPAARAEITWHSWATVNKRSTYVFDYKVAQAGSHFEVASAKKQVTVPFSGQVFVDAETRMPTRVFAVGQSPATFPVHDLTFDVIYDFIKIGDQQVVLPVKADIRAREGKLNLIWNEFEYRRYRKAGADSADNFGQR